MDGVLIHSAEAHRRAFHTVFKPLGINDFEYCDYAGWRTAEVVRDVLERRGIPSPTAVVEQAAIEKSRLAREMLNADYPMDTDSAGVIGHLGANYRLALATSGSRGSLDAFFRHSGTNTFFQSVLCGDNVVHAKPHPEIYSNSIQQLGLDPGECLVVEDAVAGVKAARAAGASVVGVSGTVAREKLLDAGADCVIQRLGELPGLLTSGGRQVDQSQWTAIIPAAGKGSRLGFHRSKILFPVAERMILEWMLDFLAPCYAYLVFVLSPEGHEDVAGELNRLIPGRFEIVIQHAPTGMGDAVELALPHVKTPHVTVVWGDQVTLQRSSVEACQKLHEGPLRPDLTCPTVWRANPYIHFERDEAGSLNGLRQAREGDQMPARGESDTGFFCFETPRLVELLRSVRCSSHSSGTRTGEFNMLPVIPLAARQGLVLTPHLMSLEETQGINSTEDAVAVAEFLRRSHGSGN